MAKNVDNVTLDFFDEFGESKCKIQIFSSLNGNLYVLNQEEARAFAEEQVQLVEDSVYEYKVLQIHPKWELQNNPVLIPSKISNSTGRIEPKAFTGILPITIQNTHTQQIATIRLEVRSTKLSYREDYRRMLDNIATFAIDLVVDIRSPSQIRLLPNASKSPETIQQRFAFLKSIIGTKEFNEAIQRIISDPHSQLVFFEQERAIQHSGKISSKNIRQIIKSDRRVELPYKHPLAEHLRSYGIEKPSVPLTLSYVSKRDTKDTQENRFVKYVLVTFVEFLINMERSLSLKSSTNQRLSQDIQLLRIQIDSFLAQDFFREISQVNVLSLSSPVLQNKAGYREILAIWLKFNIAATLVWHGGEDVYGAGKRSVANLYEYWVFFALLKIVRKHFEISKQSLQQNLFEKQEQGLGLKLKSGRSLAVMGTYVHGERRLNIIFSYNRTFSPVKQHTLSGSWTLVMRPDYTLSIYPASFSPEEAEAQSLMIHIHFDAKYKIDTHDSLFREEKNEINDIAYGVSKRDDLLKMHAYLGAIRRSEGAYIIYPGSENQRWQNYYEILPGIGAFRLHPGENGKIIGGQELSNFIGLVISHLLNRTTRWEQHSYHEQRVQNSPSSFKVIGPVPERQGDEGKRITPLSEQVVLVGKVNTTEQIEWILNNKKFAQIIKNKFLAPFQVSAKYIFVNGLKTPLLKIISHAPQILHYHDLIALDYPYIDGTANDIFLLYNIVKDDDYEKWTWNEDALEAINVMHNLTLDHLLFLGDFQE